MHVLCLLVQRYSCIRIHTEVGILPITVGYAVGLLYCVGGLLWGNPIIIDNERISRCSCRQQTAKQQTTTSPSRERIVQ